MSNESSLKIVKNTEYNSLDQLIQIIEISFVFLITFSLIALVDSAFNQANLYAGIASDYLGERDIGSLRGGNYEEIVRITLIFNLFLFAFSLFFGIWIRRTRDGWTWPDFGYSFRTEKYTFGQLMSRGVLLGLVAVLLHFLILSPVFFYLNGDEGFLLFAYSYADGNIYSAQALNSEYYFGIVEMGFIWPASAGFFFFAYVYTSINNKFPTGVANLLATFFYVFYLIFFFIIQGGAKIEGLKELITNPNEYIVAWITIFSLLVILYINFASFAETKSIVVPFVMNFVFNVGITLVRAVNSLIFFDTGNDVKMLIIPLIVLFIVIIWYIKRKDDFSTIKTGVNHLRTMNYSIFRLIAFFILFMLLSFLVPGIINELLYKKVVLDYWVIPTLFAIDFLAIISLSVVVLTYEPTDVHDVLLISNDGLPIGSHIELFETDDVLISGFFTALASVDQELSQDSGLKSIKRGNMEILIEDGVNTRLIVLADRDQKDIRNQIQHLFRKFEVETSIDEIEAVNHGKASPSADKLVEDIGKLSNTFSIPDQTRWIATLSLVLGPLMLILIGLI